jgi:hypothetical protein
MRDKLVCNVCGEPMDSHFDGISYCKKHYLQMRRHGKILKRTIFDKNEWIIFDNYAACITYKKDGTPNSIVKVDLDYVEDLKKYKIYCRTHDCGKQYACICIDGRKILLHRYLMNIHNQEYTIKNCIDHINGDSLDNRIANLRVCTVKQNTQNVRKGNKIIGISKSPNKNNRWIARIMSNYRTINLGYFDTYEEAVIARLSKEKEICGEFGPNKDLYYILEHLSPIEELKRVLSERV